MPWIQVHEGGQEIKPKRCGNGNDDDPGSRREEGVHECTDPMVPVNVMLAWSRMWILLFTQGFENEIER